MHAMGRRRRPRCAMRTRTTTGSRDRTSPSMRMVVTVTVVALLEPATEAGGEGLCDVTVLAEGSLRDLGPLSQDLLGVDQRAHRVGHETEVRERDTGRSAFGEATQRHDRLLEIEVRRWRAGAQHAGIRQT